MREERGQILGDLTIDELFTLWGTIGGNVTVIKGGKFYLRGELFGSMIVESKGRVHVFGNMTGGLTIKPGGKVVVSGTIKGKALNEGGRLYLDKDGDILGGIQTVEGGETTIEPKPFPTEE